MSKEINFKDPGCTDTLASGLNYYSQHFDFKDSKKWALEWLKNHLPDEYDRLKDEKEHKFSNRGFVCRMCKNGLVLSDQQKHDLTKFFLNMPTTVSEVVERDTSPSPKRKPAEVVNPVIFQMEDVVDAILSDKEPKPVEIPIDKSKLNEAQAWLEKEIIDAQEQVEKQKAILEQLTSVYERCGGIKSKLAAPKPKAKPKVKETTAAINADKAKAIKTLNYKKKDEETGIESLSPARLVGAKEALIYNTKYRTVVHFVAKPGEGLAVSGSSIRNHDDAKSTSKTVRKPKDFFAVSDRWKAFDLLKTAERKASTFVSSEMMIIEVR